jgi:hypothetical protein
VDVLDPVDGVRGVHKPCAQVRILAGAPNPSAGARGANPRRSVVASDPVDELVEDAIETLPFGDAQLPKEHEPLSIGVSTIATASRPYSSGRPIGAALVLGHLLDERAGVLTE